MGSNSIELKTLTLTSGILTAEIDPNIEISSCFNNENVIATIKNSISTYNICFPSFDEKNKFYYQFNY